MLTIESCNDETRKFVAKMNGVMREFDYPLDIVKFTDFKPDDVYNYVSGFMGHFETVDQSSTPMLRQEEWF